MTATSSGDARAVAVERVDARAVYENLSAQRAQVVDARAGGRAGADAAWIPGSIAVDALELMRARAVGGVGRAREALEARGVDARGTAIVASDDGATAEATAAVLVEVGVRTMILEGGYAAWSAGGYPTIVGGGVETANATPRRLIIWANPRSRSTAFERSLSMHSKAKVMHELLTEPYLKERNPQNYAKIVNGQTSQAVESSACGYAAALEVLTTDFSSKGKPFTVSKELSCYFDFEKITDEWLLGFNHVVLTRNPLDALKSFYRVSVEGQDESSYFDANEAGFIESCTILHRLNGIGARCIAIDADHDLLRDPEGSLREVCSLAGMDFETSMLQWTPKERGSWKKFRGWHADASNSSGFCRVEKVDIPYPEAVYAAARLCQPYYEAVLWSSVCAMHAWPTLRLLPVDEHKFSIVICATGEHAGRDMHAKLLAARLPGASVYIFQPKWVEEAETEAETRCLRIFEEPLILCGSPLKVMEMNQALQTRLKYGSSKVARAILIATCRASTSVDAGSLPFPTTLVNSRRVIEDDKFIGELSEKITIELDNLRASSESDTDVYESLFNARDRSILQRSIR